MDNYEEKYLKYKNKYINLKNLILQQGGKRKPIKSSVAPPIHKTLLAYQYTDKSNINSDFFYTIENETLRKNLIKEVERRIMTKRNISDAEATVYYAALEAQFSRSFLCDNKAPTCIDDEVATVNLAVKLNDYINSYKSKENKSPELMKKHAINIYSHVFIKKQSHDGGSILNLFGGGDSELTTLSSPTQYGGFNLSGGGFNLLGGGFNLLGGGNEKPEIYLFKADWCPHCTGFKPTWEKLSKNLKSKYNFTTFDADKDGEKIKKWNIKGFPTIIKKTGNNMEEYVGPRDEISVREFIEAN